MFNYAGLPIQQDGPLLFSSAADTTGYWPQTTWVWDNHDELVCQRDPAANAEKRGCFLRADGTVNDGADGLATTYTYDTLTPYPMLSETDPRPNPDGTGTRRSVSFKYDGSSSFNGLWSEEFNSQYATGLPVNEGMWSTFDNYSGVPGPVDGTHDWAMRFAGYLIASSSTKYFFKVVSSNPILLAVGNHVLFDCFDQGTRLGSTQKASNCDGSDASAVMFGGRQTFTFEIGSNAGGGQVSFSMKWGKATASGNPPATFSAIGATDTDPNLVLMTRRETAPPGSPGAYQPDLVENWSYLNDFQMASRQPDSYTRTDASTDAANDPMAAQARQTSYSYDHASGKLLTKVLPDPAGLGASEQPKYLYTYADPNDPGCRSKIELRAAGVATSIDDIRTRNCDPSGYLKSLTQQVEASGLDAAYNLTTTYVRDPFGAAVAQTGPEGATTYFTFDNAGRLTRQEVPVGTVTVSPTPSTSVSTYAVTDYSYDVRGRLVTQTLPDPGQGLEPWGGAGSRPVISFGYDAADNQIWRSDARSPTLIWCTAYDALDRVASTTTPVTANTPGSDCRASTGVGGLTTTTFYQLGGSPGVLTNTQTVTAPDGVATVTTSNVVGDQTAVKVGAQAATTYGYDVFGDRTQITSAPVSGSTSSITETMTYDAFGELALDNAPAPSGTGQTTATTTSLYNALGERYRVKPPRSALATTDPNYANDKVDYGYDLVGDVTSVTMPGLADQNQFTFTYDEASHLVKATSPLSTNAAYASVSAVTRTWRYDPVSGSTGTGLLRRYTTGTGTGAQTTDYPSYDLWGSPAQISDPRGLTITDSYDNIGNLIDRSSTGGTSSGHEAFQYDQLGNQTQATEVGSVTTAVTYEAADRISQVTQGTATTTYAYDASAGSKGHLSSVTDPVGTTSLTYDSSGRLARVTDPFTTSDTVYSYDTAGRLTSRTDPAGLTWSRTYDSASGLLQGQTVTLTSSPTTTLQSSAQTFDVEGNVLTDAEQVTQPAGTGGTNPLVNGTWSYTYDAANRLSCQNPPAGGGPLTGYVYDGMGNRVAVQKGSCAAGGGTITTTKYDSRGLPTSSSDGTSYCYDPAGNMTGILAPGSTGTCNAPASTDQSFTYDPWNRTATAKVPSTAQTTYSYDALGRVASASVGTQLTTDVWQGTSFDLVRQTTPTTTTNLAYGPYGPLAQSVAGQAGSIRFFLKNLHGDVVGLAKSGATTPTLGVSYDPWGAVLQTAVSNTDATGLGFQGDPALTGTSQGGTPLVETPTRIYDPALGRFDTQDSVFGAASDPLSYNQYVYGDDSPVAYSDPTGMGPCHGHDRCQANPPDPDPGQNDPGQGSGDGGGDGKSPGSSTTSNGQANCTRKCGDIVPPWFWIPPDLLGGDLPHFTADSGELDPVQTCVAVAGGFMCTTVSWSFSITGGDSPAGVALAANSGLQLEADRKLAGSIGLFGNVPVGAHYAGPGKTGSFGVETTVGRAIAGYGTSVAVGASDRYLSGAKTTVTETASVGRGQPGGPASASYSVTVDQGFSPEIPSSGEPIRIPPLTTAEKIVVISILVGGLVASAGTGVLA